MNTLTLFYLPCALLYLSRYLIITWVTIYAINALKYSPAAAGLLASTVAVGKLTSDIVTGFLLYENHHLITLIGVLLMTVSSMLMLHESEVLFPVLLYVFGCGMGMCQVVWQFLMNNISINKSSLLQRVEIMIRLSMIAGSLSSIWFYQLGGFKLLFILQCVFVSSMLVPLIANFIQSPRSEKDDPCGPYKAVTSFTENIDSDFGIRLVKAGMFMLSLNMVSNCRNWVITRVGDRLKLSVHDEIYMASLSYFVEFLCFVYSLNQFAQRSINYASATTVALGIIAFLVMNLAESLGPIPLWIGAALAGASGGIGSGLGSHMVNKLNDRLEDGKGNDLKIGHMDKVDVRKLPGFKHRGYKRDHQKDETVGCIPLGCKVEIDTGIKARTSPMFAAVWRFTIDLGESLGPVCATFLMNKLTSNSNFIAISSAMISFIVLLVLHIIRTSRKQAQVKNLSDNEDTESACPTPSHNSCISFNT